MELPLMLSWPASVLSPNSRAPWQRVRGARREQRHEAKMITLAGIRPARRHALAKAGRLKLHLEFVPPNRRARDADNLLAACKGAIDGIADAIGLDDRYFVVSFELLEPAKKAHGVRVRVEAVS